MYHRLWVMINILVFAASFIYIWFMRPHDSVLIITGQLLAQIGVILFLININMYFIFLVIRKTSIRKVKIRLAKFSRIIMKWHITIAVAATTIITGHGVINTYEIAPLIGYDDLKLWSGYISFVFLIITLMAGYLRHKKASGFRRRFHLFSAMSFLGAFLLHMFIQPAI